MPEEYTSLFLDNTLFIAQVIQVYPKRVVGKQQISNNVEVEIVHEAYTIDVKPAAHRLAIQGVRVITSNTGGSNKILKSGEVYMPSIGDWVVCAYLEGYPDFAVCLGAIYNPGINEPSEQGEVIEDYVIHHQSDSFIRMRNLEKAVNPSSTISRSEIKINHKTGTKIELTEPSVNKCECNILHNSGTLFKIDVDGNIEIYTKKDIKVLGKSVVLGDEAKAQGVQTAQTIGFCRFTGEPFQGLPNIKAG